MVAAFAAVFLRWPLNRTSFGICKQNDRPLVSAAAVHFEETCQYFSPLQSDGLPVRAAFFSIARKLTARQLCCLWRQSGRACHQSSDDRIAAWVARERFRESTSFIKRDSATMTMCWPPTGSRESQAKFTTSLTICPERLAAPICSSVDRAQARSARSRRQQAGDFCALPGRRR